MSIGPTWWRLRSGWPGRLGRLGRLGRSAVGALAGAVLLLVVGAGPAAADPAGPTDYRSEVTGLVPPTGTVRVEVVGGDSFLLLAADPGTVVQVTGYRGEPYLRIEADGTVERNERSPTRWLNDNRYGAVAVPASASTDPKAEPDWHTVGGGGHYAWHDHRAHWMGTAPPPASHPGEVVLEAEVPLVVNGTPVAVQVRSTRLAAPSVWPAVLGVVAAALLLAAVVGAALITRHRRPPDPEPAAPVAESGPGTRPGSSNVVAAAVALAAAVWSAAALGIGWWAYRSVPPETGPSILGWAPPLAALALAAGAVWWARQPARASQALHLTVLLGSAGLELAWWAWLQRATLWRALIPTHAPADLHRAVAAGSPVVALAALATAGSLARLVVRRLVPLQPGSRAQPVR